MNLSTIQNRAFLLSIGAELVLKNLLSAYPQFEWWSGSHGKALHHYGRGGLAQHTAEVIELGFNCREVLNMEKEIDPHTFFFAALFHDTGKMFDFERVSDDVWIPTSHRRLIHHLPRSALIWHDIIEKRQGMAPVYHDKVLHAILSHHGSREAGSPVAPKTREAWLLHLCDGVSARMNDADTLDVVKADEIRR